MTSRSKTTSSLATALAEGRAFDPSAAKSGKKSKSKNSSVDAPAASVKTDSTRRTTSTGTASPVLSASSSVYSDHSDTPTMSSKFRRIFSPSSSSSSHHRHHHHHHPPPPQPPIPAQHPECPVRVSPPQSLKPRTLKSGAVVMEIVVPSGAEADPSASDSATTPTPTTTSVKDMQYSQSRQPVTSSHETVTATRPQTAESRTPLASPAALEFPISVRPKTTESQVQSTSSASFKSAPTSLQVSPSSSPTTTALPPIPSRCARRMSNPRVVRYPAHLIGLPPGPAPSKPLPSLPAGVRASKRASQLQSQLALEGITLPLDDEEVKERRPTSDEAASVPATPSSNYTTVDHSPTSTARTSQESAVSAASGASSSSLGSQHKLQPPPLIASPSPTPSAFPSVPSSPHYSIFPTTYRPKGIMLSTRDAEDTTPIGNVSTVEELEELFSGPSAELAKEIVRTKSQRDSPTAGRAETVALVRGCHEHLYVKKSLKRPSSFQGRNGDETGGKTRRSLEEENKALKGKVATLEARLMAVELRAKYLAAVFGDGGFGSSSASGSEEVTTANATEVEV